MRIAVTGRTGQVARALVERAGVEKAGGHTAIAVERPAFDLAGDSEDIYAALAGTEPDVIVSAAAHTAVDRAESEPARAFALNASGAGAVAAAARRLGVPLIHLSTNYVFDGARSAPYRESDPAKPLSVYGASKLAGERLVLGAHADSVILRTAWVFSPFGTNFVRTMLRLAEDRDEVRVVADQEGNPTSALALADAILAIAVRLRDDTDAALRGVFHLAGAGETSWAGLAEAVFEVSRRAGGASATVVPILTVDYPAAAARPPNSRLDCRLLHTRYGVALDPWRDAVEAVVSRLIKGDGR
jgi:dTDP-4-dehydrorhamnose reductase